MYISVEESKSYHKLFGLSKSIGTYKSILETVSMRWVKLNEVNSLTLSLKIDIVSLYTQIIKFILHFIICC